MRLGKAGESLDGANGNSQAEVEMADKHAEADPAAVGSASQRSADNVLETMLSIGRGAHFAGFLLRGSLRLRVFDGVPARRRVGGK